MILFTILSLLALIITAVALVITGTVSAAVIVVFGDLFVCALIIGLIIKCLINCKK